MQRVEIEAVYVQGTLNLPRKLPLPEGQKVIITIEEPTVPSPSVGDGEGATEPTVELRWNKARRKIRAAARKYSEQTHADY